MSQEQPEPRYLGQDGDDPAARQLLYDRIVSLGATRLTELLHRLQTPKKYLPGSNSTPVERSVALLEYVDSLSPAERSSVYAKIYKFLAPREDDASLQTNQGLARSTARDAMRVELTSPPAFCQYVDGPCDQSFDSIQAARTLFVYPHAARPAVSAIEEAIASLRQLDPQNSWSSWRDTHTGAKLVFCNACKAARFAELVVADVTHLDFNVVFAIGVCLGLEIPVQLAVNKSASQDGALRSEFALLDSFDQIEYANPSELAMAVLQRSKNPRTSVIPPPPKQLSHDAPLYVVKYTGSSADELHFLSLIKKSRRRVKPRRPAA
jgi:hypothetical protein